jgi:hypothetical protein
MDFRKIGWEAVDWIDLAEDRGQVVGRCEGDDEILGSLKCGEFLDQQSNCYVPLHAVSYF